MTTPIEKLRAYGYELPRPKPPVASYVPVTRTGNILYVSGQISIERRRCRDRACSART